MPLSTVSFGSSSQILFRKFNHSCALSVTVGSCNAPPTLIGITGRSGYRLLNSSTSLRTQRGSCKVPWLAMTTRLLELKRALRSVSSRGEPGRRFVLAEEDGEVEFTQAAREIGGVAVCPARGRTQCERDEYVVAKLSRGVAALGCLWPGQQPCRTR